MASSAHVVEGHVVGVRWAEAPDMPLIYFTVRVDEVFTPDFLPLEVEVVVPGGPWRDVGYVEMVGAPYFLENEHVVLPIVPFQNAGAFRVVSWTTGLLRERGGLAHVGGSALPMTSMSCGSTFDEHTGVGHEETVGDEEVERAMAMPWSEAVATYKDCLGGVR